MFMARDIRRLDTQRALTHVRRLDRPDCRRRACHSPSRQRPAGPRAQRGGHVVGLGAAPPPTCMTRSRPTGATRELNANGKIYGSAEDSRTSFRCSTRSTHTASEAAASRARSRTRHRPRRNAMAPSPYWGAEPIWDSKTLNHNPMFDEKGRVWFTPRIRPGANPDYCKKGSEHPSAKAFPIESGGRNLSFYDPATGKFTLIDTCFPTHHLNFASDANQTLWTSAGVGGPRRDRLAEPQDVRGDRRRSEIAGLDAIHPRYQRQRQARRLCRARPAGRSDQGQADRR